MGQAAILMLGLPEIEQVAAFQFGRRYSNGWHDVPVAGGRDPEQAYPDADHQYREHRRPSFSFGQEAS